MAAFWTKCTIRFGPQPETERAAQRFYSELELWLRMRGRNNFLAVLQCRFYAGLRLNLPCLDRSPTIPAGMAPGVPEGIRKNSYLSFVRVKIGVVVSQLLALALTISSSLSMSCLTLACALFILSFFFTPSRECRDIVILFFGVNVRVLFVIVDCGWGHFWSPDHGDGAGRTVSVV